MKAKVIVAFLLTALMILSSCGTADGPGKSSDTAAPQNGGTDSMTDFTTQKTWPVSVEVEVPADATNLPAFTVSPAAEKLSAPGGEALPEMTAGAAEGAPMISELSEMTFPDETLAVAGHNLEKAGVIIWTEGSLRAVIPLRSDNSKLEVTIPSEMTRSTTLVWPYNDSGVGAPVRINAPDVYWADPGALYSGVSGQEIRFFGSGFKIEGRTPSVVAVYENGEAEELEVLDADEYQIRAKLKSPVSGGSVTFFCHNGTGGKYGWSEPFTVGTAEYTLVGEQELMHFRVDDYGAVAGDGKNDLSAINSAVSAAAKEGGGVIEFGEGEYNIANTLQINGKFPKGLYIKGAGEGNYDMKSGLGHDEYDHVGLSGKYTLIKFADPAKVGSIFIYFGSDNVFVSDMTVIGGDNGDHNSKSVFIHGENVSLENVRMIKTDLRDFSAKEISVGSNLEIDNYSRNITVKNCEFHQQGSAVNIGNIEGIWPWGYFDSERTIRNVRISGCDVYGYAGPYKSPDGRSAGDLGEISRGLIGFNLQGLVFENNTVQGYDKEHCKLLVRSIYVNASSEKMYIAGNTFRNVGNIPESGFDLNTGEQILIHGNDYTGGIFNVKSDGGEKITVRTDNISDKNGSPYSKSDNTGSRIFSGLEKGDRGYLYVYGGKGVGQSRSVTGYRESGDTIEFTLNRPFTVPLDETSVVDLISYSGYNIIRGNSIGNDHVVLHEGLKTGGVLLFFQGGYNIIAGNDFHNLTFGVAINARFKGPTVWNTVRDNVFSGMTELRRDAAQGGDSTYNATFFCVSVVKSSPEGWDDYNAWYAVGNVFRNNVCRDGDYAAELTTNRWNRGGSEWDKYHGDEKGAAMSIIEINRFEQVKTGVLIGNPDYWSVMRNNVFDYSGKPGYKKQAYTFEQGPKYFWFLCIDGNTVKSDSNESLNEGWNQSTVITE
ncbi:MAG: hypothetical protein J6Z80_01640 [Clostridia bacterium]|nr:hypothetical protein [Clostridia bacterium]